MKDSIKAREYFHVKRGAESDTGREMRGIYDGDELICAGYVMTEQDQLSAYNELKRQLFPDADDVFGIEGPTFEESEESNF